MGKIRVQDLATMMGISNQDLVFKMKSLGVRVEGDDAHIDTENLQAFLQGKKLPHPREVILRDEQAPAAAAAARRAPQSPAPATPTRRPLANPLQRQRPRTLIQKVEPRIQTLPMTERYAPQPQALEPSPALAAAAQETSEPEVLVSAAVAAPVEAPAPQPVAAAPAVERRETPAPPPSQRPSSPPYSSARPGSPSQGARPGGPSGPGGNIGSGARPGAPGYRPGGPGGPGARPGGPSGPGNRPGAPGARSGPAPTRPGGPAPTRPGQAMAPSMLSTEEQKRRAAERMQEQIERDKRKKGTKKPGPRPGGEENLTSFKGTLEDLEEGEDAANMSGRRRRRTELRKDEADGGKVLTFKKDKPAGAVMISEGMTLREFAEKLGVRVRDLMGSLFKRGIMANINQVLDPELAQELARELGVETMVVSFEEEVQLQQGLAGNGGAEQQEAGGKRVTRGPVVTIMGHVDHGKTSLLDAIRKSKLTEAESGGITQHIGAYHVDVHGRQIVFVDTPGHEAFTMMRARGARITDIVILVVAADDGVMPQTIEAIDHARAAKVPIVVAINKIDKPNANLDRVKKELSDRGLVAEDWGGDTVMVPISALKREGIPELLEMLLLTADILDLKANPDIPAQGAVIEARKEVGRGTVATVLVQNGTLKVGDVFVSGSAWGKVRSMSDDAGQRSQKAGPSTPVEVTGFNDLPDAGDMLQVVEDEAKARSIAEFRSQESRRRGLAPSQARMSLDQLFTHIQEGEVKELPVVLKADVQGSVEVLREALGKASTEKVKVLVLHSGIGAISTNDVLLASASKAIIIGFNVRPERAAVDLAEKEEVEIRLHTVIYELIDELRKAMTGLLEPTFREVSAGRAEVRDTFKVPKVGTIAGCHVVEGVIPRTAAVRLLRDNRVIYEGKISSLRRFKDDASEVRTGFDCGIGLERFQDFKPGDVIEAYTSEEVAPVL
ncbi:MAG TPA: translation initiation factor IF-2 [Thermoanaerobaculia bacterium]|jgi:translation initiation factor IF-2|nr:translation initiation factor IF-2 [Thermoanaerobaculia bacterium]